MQPEFEEEPEPIGGPLGTRAGFHTPVAAAFRHIRPFWRNYIQYVDLAARAGDDRAKKYRDAWLALTPAERKRHFPEQICDLSGVTPHELVGMVCEQLFAMETAEAGMVTAFARKEVIQAARFFGTMDQAAYKDRELVAKISGALPAPKGSSIAINVNGGAPQVNQGFAKANGVLDMDAEIVSLSETLEIAAPAVEAKIFEMDAAMPEDDGDEDTEEDDID